MKKKKLTDFNPFFFKIININEKLEYINLHYKNIKFANSLSVEDVLLLYLMISKKISVEIFLLNTGRLFLNTLILINKIKKKYNYNIIIYFSNLFLINIYIKKYTLNGFYNNILLRKICCYIRKIQPLNKILINTDLLITGQRKEHSLNRMKNFEYEFDFSRNILKYNLLLNWDSKDIFYFLEKFNILTNFMYNIGYSSIGCDPCTKSIYNNEHIRFGRWWWEIQSFKKECGLHDY